MTPLVFRSVQYECVRCSSKWRRRCREIGDTLVLESTLCPCCGLSVDPPSPGQPPRQECVPIRSSVIVSITGTQRGRSS